MPVHSTVGDRLTNTFTKEFCVRITNIFTKEFCVWITNTYPITNIFKKDFCVWTTNTYSDNEHFHERVLCLDNEHIFGGDQGYTPEIMDEILTTARDLELEVNEDDIEELIIGHENELTIK
ncbi:uncharacterized protein TNCV_2776411 [Trichonephila clavipes]|nr:uncharacterized protein TNCV_2776411 [Trichonephila clavipes]